MHEAPTASVHELARLRCSIAAGSSRRHALHFNLTWWKQVDARISPVADRNLAFAGSDVDTGEILEVSEERLVRRPHRQLQLCILL